MCEGGAVVCVGVVVSHPSKSGRFGRLFLLQGFKNFDSWLWFNHLVSVLSLWEMIHNCQRMKNVNRIIFIHLPGEKSSFGMGQTELRALEQDWKNSPEQTSRVQLSLFTTVKTHYADAAAAAVIAAGLSAGVDKFKDVPAGCRKVVGRKQQISH